MFQRDRSQDLLLSEVSVCVPLPMTVTVGPMAISWQFPSATLPVLEVILNTSHDHNCARKWALDFSPTGTVPLTLAQQWLCQMGIFYWYSREPLLWHMYSIVLGVTDSLWVFQFSQIKNSKRVCTHGVCVCVCVCVCLYLP